ncbi:MAG: hypothetical protein QOG83_264 [Alphaproteobacteria bacterium]|jgi:hypothetical protein|nr:hypothetical protein [Alphaproteobacteria bacterium]MEA2987553.1 hypothetical protein [Alphaproteobacteria bacterium]
MIRSDRVLPCLTAVLCSAIWIAPAAAQPDPDLQNSKVEISYAEPESQALQGVYQRLKNRRVLEEIKSFLAPINLPRKLPIRTKQCNALNAWFSYSEGVTLCYDYVAKFEEVAPKTPTPDGVTRDRAVTGAVVRVMLHELGHAIFNMRDVPIFGREEDAADQIAGFIMVQFGKDLARKLISGAAYHYVLGAQNRTLSRTEFSDEHGSDAQRFYNYLCLAYGAEREAFKDYVEKGLLPEARAGNCEREYRQVQNAFSKTISPFINKDLLKRVQARQWLKEEDVR